MNVENRKSCSTCAFWVEGGKQGECRANPPIPIGVDSGMDFDASGFISVWPKTEPSHWCGDWRPGTAWYEAEADNEKATALSEVENKKVMALSEVDNELLYTMICDRQRGLEWDNIAQNFGITSVQLAQLRSSRAWRDEAEAYINATPGLSHDRRTLTELGCLY